MRKTAAKNPSGPRAKTKAEANTAGRKKAMAEGKRRRKNSQKGKYK